MIYTRFMLLSFFLLMLNLAQSQSQDSTGTLSGYISMPQIKKEKRTFRGRMYRNRLSAKKHVATKSSTLKSPYLDVIIIMKSITSKVEAEPMQGVKIIQKDADFIPRVLPVTRNTVVEFINFDNFYHNVFSVTPGAKFNIGRRPKGTVVKHKIERPGEIKLFCDIHTQMNAVILSLDTPYFSRVQPDGTFKLANIPEGDYLVEVYHPDLPNIEEYITVSAGKIFEKNFTLSR